MGNQPSQPMQNGPQNRRQVPVETKEWATACKSLFPTGRIPQNDFVVFFSTLFPFGKVDQFCERLAKCIKTGERGTTKTIELDELLDSFTVLFKGSTAERCRWIFQFYDENGDGRVSRSELTSGLCCINQMVSNSTMAEVDVGKTVDEIFATACKDELLVEDFERLEEQNNDNSKKLCRFI